MVALVVGGAACVWDDIEQAFALFKPDVVAAVNNIGVDWDYPVDYLVSFHTDKLIKWADERKAKKRPGNPSLWTGPLSGRKIIPKVNTINRIKRVGGSSAYMAIVVLLDDAKADKIVLAGCPLDFEMPHYHNEQGNRPWKDGKNYRSWWKNHLSEIQGSVKSMSGWTAEVLGKPTPEWLNGN